MARNKTNKANEARWAFKKNHYKQVEKALKDIFARETFDTCMNDAELTQAVRDAGVFCTKTVTQKVRTDMGVVASDQRMIELFAKDHKRSECLSDDHDPRRLRVPHSRT